MKNVHKYYDDDDFDASILLLLTFGVECVFSFNPDFSISDVSTSTIDESKERRGRLPLTTSVVSVPNDWNTPASSTAM